MECVKLGVVSTNHLISSGIQLLINATPSIDIVQVFSSIHACQQYLKHHVIHVLLIEDSMPGSMLAAKTIANLRTFYPMMKTLVISDYLSEYYIQRLMDQGLSGFIYKEDRIEDIMVIAILTVADGHNFLSPQASVLPYGRVADGQLNNTDLEVLHLLAKGCTVKEITRRMGIVSRTVYRIRYRLRDYLCVRTNDQIVDAAIRHGLVKSSSVIKSD